MTPFRRLTARTAVLLHDDVDTDQIIPARFLKGTSREGLGRALFADWRCDASGAPRADFVMNRPEAKEAQVLVVGRNFGCGSSREHAVWALLDFGFRAVVGLSFADIFRLNALQNGLLPVVLEAGDHARLRAITGREVTIDLPANRVWLDDGTSAEFRIEPFARHCLLNGTDALSFLVSQEKAISVFEARREP